MGKVFSHASARSLRTASLRNQVAQIHILSYHIHLPFLDLFSSCSDFYGQTNEIIFCFCFDGCVAVTSAPLDSLFCVSDGSLFPRSKAGRGVPVRFDEPLSYITDATPCQLSSHPHTRRAMPMTHTLLMVYLRYVRRKKHKKIRYRENCQMSHAFLRNWQCLRFESKYEPCFLAYSCRFWRCSRMAFIVGVMGFWLSCNMCGLWRGSCWPTLDAA